MSCGVCLTVLLKRRWMHCSCNCESHDVLHSHCMYYHYTHTTVLPHSHSIGFILPLFGDPLSLNRVCGSRQVVLVRVAEKVVVIRPMPFRSFICSGDKRSPVHSHSARYSFCGNISIEDPLEVTTIATVTVLGTVIYERRITVIVTIGMDANVHELLAIVQRTDTIEVVPRTQNRNTMIRKAISLERLETFWMADVSLVCACVRSRSYREGVGNGNVCPGV